MDSVYVLGLFQTLEEWSSKLEAWIIKNYGNPLLWVGIVLAGILFFKIMFGALNRD